jgi:hypothetical protein
VDGYGLVVGDVAPAFAFAGEEFRVEGPGDYGVYQGIVRGVCVVDFGDCEDVALAGGAGANVSVNLFFISVKNGEKGGSTG